MKVALFSRVPYMGSAPDGVWPVPPAAFSPEDAERSMELFGTKVLPRMHEL
jgi:hypothetical protein